MILSQIFFFFLATDLFDLSIKRVKQTSLYLVFIYTSIEPIETTHMIAFLAPRTCNVEIKIENWNILM